MKSFKDYIKDKELKEALEVETLASSIKKSKDPKKYRKDPLVRKEALETLKKANKDYVEEIYGKTKDKSLTQADIDKNPGFKDIVLALDILTTGKRSNPETNVLKKYNIVPEEGEKNFTKSPFKPTLKKLAVKQVSKLKAEAPAKTEEPAKTEAPAKTETPAKTEEPAKDENPAKTDEPAKTETPAKAETPAKNETPTKTEKPAKAEEPAENDTNEKPDETQAASPAEIKNKIAVSNRLLSLGGKTAAGVNADKPNNPYYYIKQSEEAQKEAEASIKKSIDNGGARANKRTSMLNNYTAKANKINYEIEKLKNAWEKTSDPIKKRSLTSKAKMKFNELGVLTKKYTLNIDVKGDANALERTGLRAKETIGKIKDAAKKFKESDKGQQLSRAGTAVKNTAKKVVDKIQRATEEKLIKTYTPDKYADYTRAFDKRSYQIRLIKNAEKIKKEVEAAKKSNNFNAKRKKEEALKQATVKQKAKPPENIMTPKNQNAIQKAKDKVKEKLNNTLKKVS